MKFIILALLWLAAVESAYVGRSLKQNPTIREQHLLGEKECTYGPSFWCLNLTNAAGCHATKHCIQTVWIHQKYPEDTTSICDTCKDMVKQARDQLLSNETQEEIKEVFEGSCALLRLKPIVKECDKIADGFVPDLIDTLASEMDPQTVCAVAGLCNSAKILQLLAEAESGVSYKPTELVVGNTCDNCHSTLNLIKTKFNGLSDEGFLTILIKICARMNSYSDSCMNIAITHFHDIFSYVKENLNIENLPQASCILLGECSASFHRHEVEITPKSDIGYVQVNGKDDLPCKLCEQLVTHLKEILVANTTEAEFKQMLEGICKQTRSQISKECLVFVDTYYEEIYNDVERVLDPSVVCKIIGICHSATVDGLIAPLLPVENVDAAMSLKDQLSYHDDIVVQVSKSKPSSPVLSAQEMQLPIDLLVPPHQQLYNPEVCVFCQYFLHFLQQEISDPTVENDVKKLIDRACSKLPNSVNETCVEFVNTYEPVLVAILAQEVDPSVICPKIKVCPVAGEEIRDVDVFQTAQSSKSCPLCLYAVTTLESMIKGKKTKDEIEKSLKEVCNHLSNNLKMECNDFIDTYGDELIEMMVADFKPQEVCVFLKYCSDETPMSQEVKIEEERFGGDTETNVIFDNTVDGHPIESLNDEKCVLCEFIMKELDDELKDKKTDDEIKSLVRGICKALPTSISTSCNKFVDQYADAIIILLQEAMEPAQICAYIKLCPQVQDPLGFVREEVSTCGVCRTTADIMQKIAKNPKVDQSMKHIFEKTCRGMPSNKKKICERLTTERGIELFVMVSVKNNGPDLVCHNLSYCRSSSQVVVN
ncbi:prosaposin [Euwallacea fornicatus]|uniref:prosaposin n=1 Tax=Euwallacea fornicatus TaxID=995702 RepID=UPI00338F06F2